MVAHIRKDGGKIKVTLELNLELSVGVSGWACPVGRLVTLFR